MTRIIESLLGVSFQTELLIMTVLGLANSTLDWKPFELILRLNLIRDLNILVKDVQYSNTFSGWIKNLLKFTVILEFICSIISPFVCLMKLYPILTWKRSDILLPWLIVHALNTIVPKILSIVLAFVFHYENVISTNSLIEFLVVESINIAIAGYNWYIFFSFFLELREIEKNRLRNESEDKVLESNSVPQTCSSASNVEEISREVSIDFDESQDPIASKSLSSLDEDNEDIDKLDEKLTTNTCEENDLSTDEKPMKFLNTIPEEIKDAQQRLDCCTPKLYNILINRDLNFVLQRKNSAEEKKSNALPIVCSDDDEKITVLISKNDKKNSHKKRRISIEIDSKWHSMVKSKKTKNQSTQIMFSPSTSVTLNHSNYNLSGKEIDIPFFLRENLELLNKMYQSMNMKNQNIPKNSMQKWLIFRHEFESSLDRNLLIKNLNDNRNPTLDIFKVKEKNNILQRITKTSKNNKNRGKDGAENDGNFQLSSPTNDKNIYPKIKMQDVSDTCYFEYYKNLKPISSSSQSEDKSTHSYHTYTKTTPQNSLTDHSNNRKSILKPMKPDSQWSEHHENQKVKELRNLQAYNNLTLEQDRREMLQKKKKSKMSSYKNAMNEVIVQNSDNTGVNPQLKIDDRTSKSNPLWRNENFNYQEDRNERNSRVPKQFVRYKDFLYNNKTSDLPESVEEISENVQDIKQETVNLSRLKNSSASSNEKTMNVENLELNKVKPVRHVRTTSISEWPFEKVETLATEDEQTIPYQSSIREAIERIDWTTSPNVGDNSFVVRNSKGHLTSNRSTEENPERHNIMFDDETVTMLHNAFSFSDESERGFQLGPESNEPYPIFQVVALTMTEIFKATGWRNFTNALPYQPENEFEVTIADDVIFGDSDMDLDNCVSTRNFDAFTEITKDLNPDEIEQKKSVSVHLLDQLQELLSSSRETLSAIQNSRDKMNDSDLRIRNSEIFTKNIIELKSAFKDLLNREEKMKQDVKTIEKYISNINAKISNESSHASTSSAKSNLDVHPSIHNQNQYFTNKENHNYSNKNKNNNVPLETKEPNDRTHESQLNISLKSCDPNFTKINTVKSDIKIENHDILKKNVHENKKENPTIQINENVLECQTADSSVTIKAEESNETVRKLYIKKDDLISPSRNVNPQTTTHKGNDSFSYKQELIENYCRNLKSDIIAHRITNWNKDNAECLNSFYTKKDSKSTEEKPNNNNDTKKFSGK